MIKLNSKYLIIHDNFFNINDINKYYYKNIIRKKYLTIKKTEIAKVSFNNLIIIIEFKFKYQKTFSICIKIRSLMRLVFHIIYIKIIKNKKSN